jgi:hypothetical protein
MELDNKRKHTIDTVFVICLLLLFVLSALSVIAIGASIYKKNVGNMADNSAHRIACAYVTEKVRQADKEGRIDVEEVFGENALVLSEEVNGTTYNTYIYDYDGQLMELFARADLGSFYPQSGQKIMSIGSFDVEQVTDSMFRAIVVFDNGYRDYIYIAKRSNKAN